MRRTLIAFLCVIAYGCGSPWQGNGALYYAEMGEIKCVDAESVTFVSSRTTKFTVSGVKKQTGAALDYYSGLTCEFLEAGK